MPFLSTAGGQLVCLMNGGRLYTFTAWEQDFSRGSHYCSCSDRGKESMSQIGRRSGSVFLKSLAPAWIKLLKPLKGGRVSYELLLKSALIGKGDGRIPLHA